jgi:hypothetical protein
MADLQRSSGRRMTRREREQRAYRLTLATGGLALATVVFTVLAVVGVVGGGLPIVLAVLAVLCFVALRRSLGR